MIIQSQTEKGNIIIKTPHPPTHTHHPKKELPPPPQPPVPHTLMRRHRKLPHPLPPSCVRPFRAGKPSQGWLGRYDDRQRGLHQTK